MTHASKNNHSLGRAAQLQFHYFAHSHATKEVTAPFLVLSHKNDKHDTTSYVTTVPKNFLSDQNQPPETILCANRSEFLAWFEMSYLNCGTWGLDREARHFPLYNEENNSLHFCNIFHLISKQSTTVIPVKNNYCCDVCYKNVGICHTGSRWLRILGRNVETRYLNSSFCILTLMPFFLHWTYW